MLRAGESRAGDFGGQSFSGNAGCAPDRAQSGAKALELGQRLEHVVELFGTDLGNANATTGRDVDESRSTQPPQRLANRLVGGDSAGRDQRRRHAEALAEQPQPLAQPIDHHLDDERETALRIVAMVGIGIARVTLDRWWRERGKRSPSTYFREGFATLKSHV